MHTNKSITPSADPTLLSNPSAAAPKRAAPLRPTVAASWMRVDEAARVLDVNIVTFRRAIERNARRDAEGRVHAEFDGVRARKLGRHWRVLLDPCWSVRASA